jgi:hypothetical protein
MDRERRMGWFVVSIFLPLIAPLFALLLIRQLPLPLNILQNVDFMIPFKDAQLCWGALGLCASALYEIAVPGEHGAIVSVAYVGWANGVFITVLVAASILAAMVSIFPTSMPRPAGVPWHKHFGSFVSSLLVTTFAAGSYTVVHYGLLK